MKPVLAILGILLGPVSLGPAAFAQEPRTSQACQIACYARSQPVMSQCLESCQAGPPGAVPAARAAQQPSETPPPPSAQGLADPPPPPVTFGSVYIGNPPLGFGMAVGQADRLAAHHVAESACRASGASCSLAEDFVLPCAAVVEGVRRSPSALFMTSDPRTYVVRALTHGTASNPADAERIAMDLCRQRERGGLSCRVLAARCGPR